MWPEGRRPKQAATAFRRRSGVEGRGTEVRIRGMVAQLIIWILGTRKAEAGELQIQDQAGPHREIISF